MSRVIVYGDIHGCLDEFKQLREDIKPKTHDLEISVGDFLNKGPESLKTLRYLQENNILSVMGNNEEKIIRLYNNQKKEKIKFLKTLKPKDISYLESLPYFIKIDGLTVVHGGIENSMKLDDKLSDKEKKLLTQLRFYNKNQEPIPYDDFENREIFWSELYKGHEGFVIFGHHPFPEVKIEKYAIGIDTGCVYGGELTAISFPYHDKKVSLDTYTFYRVKAIKNHFR